MCDFVENVIRWPDKQFSREIFKYIEDKKKNKITLQGINQA